MIKLNNTEARQGVKPLSSDELHNAVTLMNLFLKQGGFNPLPIEIENWQNMLDSYQNLQHFWDVVGGWEGYNKLLATGKP